MLMPHSITDGDACFAYFNKKWGIPITSTVSPLPSHMRYVSNQLCAALIPPR